MTDMRQITVDLRLDLMANEFTCEVPKGSIEDGSYEEHVLKAIEELGPDEPVGQQGWWHMLAHVTCNDDPDITIAGDPEVYWEDGDDEEEY